MKGWLAKGGPTLSGGFICAEMLAASLPASVARISPFGRPEPEISNFPFPATVPVGSCQKKQAVAMGQVPAGVTTGAAPGFVTYRVPATLKNPFEMVDPNEVWTRPINSMA